MSLVDNWFGLTSITWNGLSEEQFGHIYHDCDV